jgi:hypothetical protein
LNLSFASLLIQKFAPLLSSPFYVFIAKRRESPPPCPIKTHEGNEATLPRRGKVAGCLEGMGCINGGRVKGMACVRVL